MSGFAGGGAAGRLYGGIGTGGLDPLPVLIIVGLLAILLVWLHWPDLCEWYKKKVKHTTKQTAKPEIEVKVLGKWFYIGAVGSFGLVLCGWLFSNKAWVTGFIVFLIGNGLVNYAITKGK